MITYQLAGNRYNYQKSHQTSENLVYQMQQIQTINEIIRNLTKDQIFLCLFQIKYKNCPAKYTNNRYNTIIRNLTKDQKKEVYQMQHIQLINTIIRNLT